MKKTKSKTEMLTSAELIKLVGASDSTLSRWVKRGLPHQRQPTGRGGAPMSLFNRDSALEWIETNASTGAALLARSARSGSKSKSPEVIPTAAELPNVDELDGEGLLECLARLQRTERDSFRLLQRLKKAGDVSGVRLVSERYVSECRALSAIEQAALSYRLRVGELVRKADAEGAYMRVLVSLKNAVLGMPNAIMPLLINYIADPNKAHEVARIMDGKVRAILRQTAERGRAEVAARAAGETEGKPPAPEPGKGKRKSKATG
jgi:hypothetical protein